MSGRQHPKKKKQLAKSFKRSGKNEATYFSILKPLIAEPKKPVAKTTLQSAPLAHLPYPEELDVKTRALIQLWEQFMLPGTPEPVIASPKPRKYRTTSKRRAQYKGASLHLLSGNTAFQNKPFVDSPLEPDAHSKIYIFLQKIISEPTFKLIAQHLNYIIVRGNYDEQVVIFNVDTLNGPVVRKLKILANHLQKQSSSIAAAYIYPDPSRSDYYLEERQSSDHIKLKKLFGKAHLSVKHLGLKYSYHPTSFSQVNESMVPTMLESASELLNVSKHVNLLDLYCGYGLFSHYFADSCKTVLGVDAEGPSIRSAMFNKKLNSGSTKSRFLSRRITERTMNEIPHTGAHEYIILDPPKKGPADGVIDILSKRGPEKVLHVFCGVDQIQKSIKLWKMGGYQVNRIIALDMFPGTANLEVLVLLMPA